MEAERPPDALLGVIDRLPAPALLADDDSRLVHANAAAQELLGQGIQDILGCSIEELVSETFDVPEAWNQFTQQGRQQGEIGLRTPDGSIRPTYYSAVRDFAPGFHLAVLTDLEQLKRIEASIRHSEELYAKAFNLTPAPTNIRRLADGVFVDVNQAFSDSLGYWRSEIVGKTAVSIGLWQEPRLLMELMKKAGARTAAVESRANLVLKDRTVREFSVAFRRVEIFGEPHLIAVYNDLSRV